MYNINSHNHYWCVILEMNKIKQLCWVADAELDKVSIRNGRMHNHVGLSYEDI